MVRYWRSPRIAQYPGARKILDLSYGEQHFSPYQLRKLTELLLNAHVQEPHINILKHYSIPKSEINLRISCPHCSNLSMERIHACWYCPPCKISSKDAHIQVVEDYILLFGSINNQQCRELLRLDSIHTTKRILKAMNLKSEGKNKGTVYYLNM